MVKAGICETVVAHLSHGIAEVKIFDGGQPEVDRQTIEWAATVARAYSPNVVIGLGGGSNLDLAKAVALLVKYPGPLSTYYGENNVPGPIAPVVAVPTTAGTGSEVSPVAVVADPERAMKVGIASRALIPKWAVVDPALTVSCPASVTAHSGMDALAHAIESFCARGTNRLLSARDLRRQESDVGRSRDQSDFRNRKIPSDGGSSTERPRCKARNGFGKPPRRNGILGRRNGRRARAAISCGRSDAHAARFRKCRSVAHGNEKHHALAHSQKWHSSRAVWIRASNPSPMRTLPAMPLDSSRSLPRKSEYRKACARWA